jgi:hypothetical protein
MTVGPPEDRGPVEIRGESRNSRTFAQIGTEVIQLRLPEQAFRLWAEQAAQAGAVDLPRLGLFVVSSRTKTTPATGPRSACSRRMTPALFQALRKTCTEQSKFVFNPTDSR